MTATIRKVLAGAALGLTLLAGCGGSPIGDLAGTIGDIDDSIVDGDLAQARDQLDELLDEAAQAERDGALTASDVERIEAAADVLRERLEALEAEQEETPSTTPTDEPTAEETTEPTPEPTTATPSPEETDEDEPDEDEGGGNGNGNNGRGNGNGGPSGEEGGA